MPRDPVHTLDDGPEGTRPTLERLSRLCRFADSIATRQLPCPHP